MQLLDVLAPVSENTADLCKSSGVSEMKFRIIAAGVVLSKQPVIFKWASPIRVALKELVMENKEALEAEMHQDSGLEKDMGEGAGDEHAQHSEDFQSEDEDDELDEEDYSDDGKETMHASEMYVGSGNIYDRWKRTKTLPVDIFVDIVRDSLELENLDVQFGYFAFFRSAFSLMLEIQEAVKDILEPQLWEDSRVR